MKDKLLMLSEKEKRKRHINYQINGTLTQALRVAFNLEQRLKESFNYVEPVEDNYETYSLESRSIVLEACIQIESIAQLFYSLSSNRNERFSWKKLYDYIESFDTVTTYNSEFPPTSSAILYLANAYVEFLPFKTLILWNYSPIHLMPWKEVRNKKMPSWWNDGYNKIKHDSNLDISFCTYYKAIEAIAGLYVMIAFISSELDCPINRNTEFRPRFFYSRELDNCFQ